MYLLRVLIGSLDNLCLLWLAGIINLVLVLRHSFEKHSLYLKANQIIQNEGTWQTLFHETATVPPCKTSLIKQIHVTLSFSAIFSSFAIGWMWSNYPRTEFVATVRVQRQIVCSSFHVVSGFRKLATVEPHGSNLKLLVRTVWLTENVQEITNIACRDNLINWKCSRNFNLYFTR